MLLPYLCSERTCPLDRTLLDRYEDTINEKILRRAAASLLVGCSLLMSGNAHAQNFWKAATDPVRNLFQQDRFTASEIQRARDEARLTKGRVELERKTQLLAREYIEYNANVSAYLNYSAARQSNASALYLPAPVGLIVPNATGLFIPGECYETSSVSTQTNSNQNVRNVPTLVPAYQPGTASPAFQLGYAPSESIQQQSYPPAPHRPTRNRQGTSTLDRVRTMAYS